MLNEFILDSCESIDTDLPGNDIDSVLDVPTWDQCSFLCTQNSACFFWTWVDENYTVNPAIIHKCHLKSGNTGSAQITGLVSGVSGCMPGKKSNHAYNQMKRKKLNYESLSPQQEIK